MSMSLLDTYVLSPSNQSGPAIHKLTHGIEAVPTHFLSPCRESSTPVPNGSAATQRSVADTVKKLSPFKVRPLSALFSALPDTLYLDTA
jgi:hypothetical protein